MFLRALSPAFVVVITGVAAIDTPLTSLLPPAPPACNLLVTPDVLEAAFSGTGSIDTQWVIPNSFGLVGFRIRKQLVLLEVDPSLVIRSPCPPTLNRRRPGSVLPPHASASLPVALAVRRGTLRPGTGRDRAREAGFGRPGNGRMGGS